MKARTKASRGTVLLPILALMYPVTAFIGAEIDGQLKVRDASGYLMWVSTSDVSGLVRNILVVFVTLFAVILLSGSRFAALGRVQLGIVMWPLVILVAMLLRGDYLEAAFAFSAVVVLAAVGGLGVTESDLRRTAWVAIGVMLSLVIYALVNPSRALLECRPDKCSPIGSMLTSYMPQENVVALYSMAGLAVVLVGLKSWSRLFGAVLCTAVVGATGSRAAIAAAAMLLVVALLQRGEGPLGLTARLIGNWGALIATIVSLVIFSGADFLGELTGRGFIFDLLRGYFVDSPIIGPGHKVLAEAYSDGASANYLLAHEHGQAPYLLINGGVLALLAFGWFAILVGRRSRQQAFGRRAIGILALSMGLFFVTEPSWVADPRSSTFWSLALVVGLMAAKSRSDNLNRKGERETVSG